MRLTPRDAAIGIDVATVLPNADATPLRPGNAPKPRL